MKIYLAYYYYDNAGYCIKAYGTREAAKYAIIEEARKSGDELQEWDTDMIGTRYESVGIVNDPYSFYEIQEIDLEL